MRELPELEGDYQEPTTSESDTEKTKKSFTRYNIEANFDNKDREILSKTSYPRPTLGETHGEVKNDVKVYTGKIAGLKRKKTEQEKKLLKCFKCEKIC